MKFRSTVHWPEKNVGANEIVDTSATDAPATAEEMRTRVAEGFAVEEPATDAPAEPTAEPAVEATAEAEQE